MPLVSLTRFLVCYIVFRNQELDPESQVGRSDRSAKKKTYAKMVIWIDWILLISSVIGVSLDPLFFQSPVIKEDKKCLSFDKRLYITAICVRSVTDLIYIANTILAISETSRKPIRENEMSAVSKDANRPKAEKTGGVADAEGPKAKKTAGVAAVADAKGRKAEKTAAVLKAALRKARMQWRRWNFLLVDILAVLPLPLVLITLIFSKEWEPKFLDERGFLNAALLFQYVPRILRIYLTWIKLIRTDDIFVMAVGIKAGFNFFLYIISSQEQF
ncbi:Cyclic nucleotide-gated ion channel 1 [Morella rubra]|uniref:Cyclic nucleotide-gated ion channel 1 n=1 Tax=Morella rubra TaxID=262757 RepID=A0A6A1V0S4_9ROSI|nr:Cyclic nucleotide-gated ion channel 1 [Morella rubra]KAB1206243.1 Cyclic nucleotide-gated ion channel 1 [Morella rubra]